MENHNRLTLILVVLQGDTVAHILFIIVLDYAMRTALKYKETDLGFTLVCRLSRRHPVKFILDLSYEDVIALIPEEIENTQLLLSSVEMQAK